MALGQSHEQGFLQQWMEDQSLRSREIYPQESGVKSIACYAFYQLGWTALGQRHGHQRKRLAELADDTRYQWMKRRRTRKRHRNSAFLASRYTPCQFKRAIEVCERRMGAVNERTARVRQRDAARHPTKQLKINVLFDRLDEAAERWLCNTEPLRRAGDVSFLGNCNEGAEMSEFHRMTPML
jgi:hypothetical protein